jgi:two-component system chemotaxis response regulator CheY
MGTLAKLVSWESREPIGKVMVVDDKIMARLSVSRILAASGFEVIQARDGLEALAQFQVNPRDVSLVIMDMPAPGGIEAVNRIREINPSAKVLLAGGRTELMATDAQPDAVLPKPLRLGSFCETVQELLKVERRRSGNGAVSAPR